MIAFHLVSYGEFAAGQRVGARVWPHFDLLTVLKGRLQLAVGDQSLLLTDGKASLLYPRTPFDGEAETPCQAAVIHFSVTEAARSWPGCEELPGQSNKVELATLNESHLADLDRLIRWPESPRRSAARLALLTLVLGAFRDPPPRAGAEPPDPRLQPALEMIDDRLDAPPQLAELANLCNLSSSHFRSCFREQLGVSPGQYIQQVRLSEAARLLRETRTPIKAVADRCGYNQVKHFYRAFRKQFAMTPLTYRRRFAPKG